METCHLIVTYNVEYAMQMIPREASRMHTDVEQSNTAQLMNRTGGRVGDGDVTFHKTNLSYNAAFSARGWLRYWQPPLMQHQLQSALVLNSRNGALQQKMVTLIQRCST